MATTRAQYALAVMVALLVTAGWRQAPLTLTGTVRDAATGQPAAGAAVRIAPTSGADVRIEIADSDGRYRVTGLKPGRYEVSARLDGYLDGRVGQTRAGTPGRLVDITSAGVVANITLWRGAVITGTIYGSDGRPRSGIEVASLKRDVELGEPRLVPAGRPVRTNDKGEYRIFGLQPGRYYVLATPPIGGAAAWGSETDSYTYAPGLTNALEAGAIDARSGAETITNFTLQRRPVFTVAGTVDARLLSARGATLVEARLLATRAVRIVSAQTDGRFELKGLLPGRYKIAVSGPGAREADASPVASLVVEVVSGDVTDLALVPVSKTTVRGVVRLTSGRSLTATELDAVRISSVPAERDTQPGLPTAATLSADSAFALEVWPGRFALRLVTRRAGWVITRVTQNGRDVTGGLEARAGVELAGVNIHVTDAAPRLHGVVNGPPVAAGDCRVIAFAVDSRLWRTGAGVAETATASDGSFSIGSLAPGDYYVAASPLTEALGDAATLESLRSHGVRVRLDEGTTSQLTLQCGAQIPPWE